MGNFASCLLANVLSDFGKFARILFPFSMAFLPVPDLFTSSDAEIPRITTCTELPIDDTNKSTPDNKYPWLDPDDIRRNMTDKEILQMKLNLKDSVLDEKGKEEFLEKVEQFTDVFSLRDEIGTCPFIEVHLKLKDETPFFVRPYLMNRRKSYKKKWTDLSI